MTNKQINVASFVPQTQSLGPGLRAALWVQSCPFRCRGCIVPEWQLDLPNQLVKIEEAAGWIINSPGITGLTISGGEPIMQAKPLVELIRIVKKWRNLDIISFTGFTLSQLINRIHLFPEIGEYLDLLDVLIDGPYVKELDDNRGLRGSSNQKIHHLTDRLSNYNFESAPRTVEFFINNQDIVLAGIPPHGILDILNGVASGTRLPQEVSYER
jgi:anaerobic ribonucleoside-triphosphate reductase activating protein